MTVWEQFSEIFSEEYLKQTYHENVILSGALGIDNLSHRKFWPKQDEEFEIISRKALNGNYRFTKYRLKLISKGRGKLPREISIPTIRDRVTLRALCDFLSKRFESSVQFELPQNVIKDVKEQLGSGNYDGFIKLDVTNFYPTIKHDQLISRLRKRVKSALILDLIKNAISTPTVVQSRTSDKAEERGVPQGLAISNVLSTIYLSNIDRYMRKKTNLVYYRYVDDILILCSFSSAQEIAEDLIRRFNKLGLEVHTPDKMSEKSKIAKLPERFEYLGYQFDAGKIRCREGSLEKLKESLVSIFTGYKYSKIKNKGFLLWRLNLRVTGCVFENKCKGWLFYFSEINDEALLHRLDLFVASLAKRFRVDIQPKKFVRAYYQVKHNKHRSNYIPNFDDYTIEQKKYVLMEYFKKDISKLEDQEIEYEFNKRISRQVRDLLEDVQNFS